jgi:hypothetical protein
VLGKIFGIMREKVRVWRRLHNENLPELYVSPNIIRMIISRRVNLRHVARMEEIRNAYSILIAKPEGKRSLGRSRLRWEDNIRMHLYGNKSRDSSVGIALGYRLDDRGSRFRFLAGDGNFSLHHCLQNGSGAHPASNPIGTRGYFPGGKAAGA